jgi:AhpD family alkylhydroperoxidase
MSDAEGLSPRDKELIAIGASVGAGCQPCTAHRLQAAEAVRATRDEIRQTVADALCFRRSASPRWNPIWRGYVPIRVVSPARGHRAGRRRRGGDFSGRREVRALHRLLRVLG